MSGQAAGVAVVTGAGRGMGAAVARALAESGWRLVLVDIGEDDPALSYPLATREELEAVADDCRAIPVIGDVRRRADLERAVDEARSRYGGLDAAVAVAGVVAGGVDAWDMRDDAWRAVIDVNLDGVWNLARAAVPALLERPVPRRGRFVAVASTAGLRGIPRMAAYAAAKHGVVGLVRSMAVELGPHGVTANAVAPGSTATAVLDASATFYDLADPLEFAVHHPLGRLIRPEEIGAAVAWLLAPDSSGVTGVVLPVDAGMTST